MQAGLLRDFVKIEEQTVTRTATGSQSTSWSEVWSGRAYVRHASGSRRVENNEVINTWTKKVTIRHQNVFDTKMRLEIGNDKYRIVSLDEQKRDMSITFTVELINE